VVAGRDEADFADGPALSAAFAYPWALASHPSLGLLILDRFNHRLRSFETDLVSTLAGQRATGLSNGQGSAAQFDNPQGLAVMQNGEIYVADTNNGQIRQVSPGGNVSEVLGNLAGPSALAVGPDGRLYIAESRAHRILRWQPGQPAAEVFAGQGTSGWQDGPATAARFFSPLGLSFGPDGSLYVADSQNHALRKITQAGQVSTLAGNGEAGYRDGLGAAARFREPVTVIHDAAGNLLVADLLNRRVRHITPEGLTSSLDIQPAPGQPRGLALHSQALWLSDTRSHQVLKLTPLQP